MKYLASKITTPDESLCFQPKEGSCNPADNTQIVLRSASKCNSPESQFIYNPITGKLLHKCSNKSVCIKDGRSGYRVSLVVSSKCPEPTKVKTLKRTACKYC